MNEAIAAIAAARRAAARARIAARVSEIWAVSTALDGRRAEIADGALAIRARAGWMLAQVALLHADAGTPSLAMIEHIARPDETEPPRLRQLAESTLRAAEARLRGWRPAPLPQAFRTAVPA